MDAVTHFIGYNFRTSASSLDSVGKNYRRRFTQKILDS